MAVENVAMGINLRRNKNESSAAYGKYYPEVAVQKTLNGVRKARQIHCSFHVGLIDALSVFIHHGLYPAHGSVFHVRHFYGHHFPVTVKDRNGNVDMFHQRDLSLYQSAAVADMCVHVRGRFDAFRDYFEHRRIDADPLVF